MEMTSETTPTNELRNGVTLVGTNQVPLVNVNEISLPFKLYRGVLIRCPGSSAEEAANVPVNTDPIWVGIKGVTKENGMAIPPGATLMIPCDDPSAIWIISTVANQRAAWMSI